MVNYDKYSANYDITRKPRPLTSSILIAQINSAKHSNILDYGCGTGSYLSLLSEEYYNSLIVGFEPTPQMALIAEQKCNSFIAKTTRDLNMCKVSFDVVVIINVLHHIRNLQELFLEISALLEPNGRLIIITEAPESCCQKMWTQFFPSILKIDLKRFYSIQKIAESAQRIDLVFKRCICYNDYYADLSAQQIYTIAATKTISVLHEIPDSEYLIGLNRLNDLCIKQRVRPNLFVEKRCLVFENHRC